jgi:hypothetical protein
MVQIAKNGNSTGPNDVNFIHFSEEQTGILLPSCPGYPDWLPQLQLTASGRLCFWNFPAKLVTSVISNKANVGTWNYAIDGKAASAQGKLVAGNFSNGGEQIPFPTVNMTDAIYFVQNCITFHWLDQTDVNLLLSVMTVPNVYTTIKPNISKIAVGRQGIVPAYSWIMYNIQYYIIKYLKLPYNIWDNVPYTDSWARNLNLSMQGGDLAKMLSGVNFIVQPVGGPTFWDKVISAAPLIIGGIATIMTMGAAAPALVAAASGLITSTASKGIISQQTGALQTAINNSQARQNSISVPVIQSDIATYTGFWYNATDKQKNIIYFGIAAIVLVIVIYLLYKKK